MKRPSPTLALLAAATAACAAGCAARASETARDARPPVAVAVEPAARPAPSAAFRGPGSVVAAHTYRIAFEVAGRVNAVYADIGDRVRAGDVLAQVDDADYREQADAANARAREASAQAARADNGARPQERAAADASVAAARAQVARAEAAAALARSNDIRSRALFASGDVAAQQAEATRTSLVDADQQAASARAQLAAAEQQAALVYSGPRVEDRTAARAEADATRAGADLAATTLAKTRLRAPADAFVQARDIEPGAMAAPGSPAFTLTDASAPDVVVDVPVARAGAIAPGTVAIVTAAGRRVTGHVTRVEPSADTTTRTAAVRIRTEGVRLRPGDVVDVTLAPRNTVGANVPAGAIVERGRRTIVLEYDATRKTVREHAVRVADATGASVRVLDLAPGTNIVVLGQHTAEPGDRVELVDR